MREALFATHLADSRRSLAAALTLPLAALQQDLMPEDGWKPLRIDLSGPIHKQSINFAISTIEEHRRRRDFNLLVLSLHTGGGDLGESKRLAGCQQRYWPTFSCQGCHAREAGRICSDGEHCIVTLLA